MAYPYTQPTLSVKSEYYVRSEMQKVQARIRQGLKQGSTTTSWDHGQEVREWLASIESDIRRIRESVAFS